MIIRIRGAREHNLQGVDTDIGDELTVITGSAQHRAELAHGFMTTFVRFDLAQMLDLC